MTKSGMPSQTLSLRDWSLITGMGGHVKFYPYEKGGGGGDGKGFSHAGGHNKFWGSFSTVA